jgi:hypothetical protein
MDESWDQIWRQDMRMANYFWQAFSSVSRRSFLTHSEYDLAYPLHLVNPAFSLVSNPGLTACKYADGGIFITCRMVVTFLLS